VSEPTSPTGGLGHPITELWLWVSEHGPNDEGVVAVHVDHMGGWMPLLGADPSTQKWMRLFAEKYQPLSGLPFRLKRFQLVEVVDELPTKGTPPSGGIPYAN